MILSAGGPEKKFLHDKNLEVYYNSKCYTLKKPFVGIIIGLVKSQYFIPLTPLQKIDVKTGRSYNMAIQNGFQSRR